MRHQNVARAHSDIKWAEFSLNLFGSSVAYDKSTNVLV